MNPARLAEQIERSPDDEQIRADPAVWGDRRLFFPMFKESQIRGA